MLSVGRVCVKTAGRDAGQQCVIVDMVYNQHALVDGAIRRRKINIRHLEPTKNTLKIKKNASHADVASAFKTLKVEVRTTKPKKAGEKPSRKKKVVAKKEVKAKK